MKSLAILVRTRATSHIQQESGRENSLSDFASDKYFNIRRLDIMVLWLAGMKAVKHQRRGSSKCSEQSKKKSTKMIIKFMLVGK
jgi:hypothetical protein